GNVAPPALGALSFVSWVGEFRAEWKLDPELATRAYHTAERQALAARGESAIILTLFEHHGAAKVLEALGRLTGATVHFVEDEGGILVISATVRSTDVPALATLRDVHYIEAAPEITLRNATTRWIVQSNVMNITPIWDHGIIGVGQIVGHMDEQIN